MSLHHTVDLDSMIRYLSYKKYSGFSYIDLHTGNKEYSEDICIALDKRGVFAYYFSYSSKRTYVVGIHYKYLCKAFLMSIQHRFLSTHLICLVFPKKGILANSVDPDQNAASDQGLYCLH